MQPLPLHNRTILIIGGTAGLGLSAALACQSAGARIVALGRDDPHADAAARSLGSHARIIRGDATHPTTIDTAIQEAVRLGGKLDALYHVAGGSGRKQGDGPLHELTDEGWRFTLDLNLTSLMLSNRAATRQFLAQSTSTTPGGSILNLASVLAFSPSPQHFHTHAYAAAKAAIIGLTQSCAAYYASHNIRFNVLAPALVDTPMAQRTATDPAIMSFIRTKQPLDAGRIGRPSDLDAAVIFFLSDQSRFATGQVLAIDGGWSVSEGQLSPPAGGGPP